MAVLYLCGTTTETKAFRDLLQTGMERFHFNVDATILILSEACSEPPVALPCEPVLVLRLYDGETPACLASFRVRDSADPTAAMQWLEEVLDWSPLATSRTRACWSKRFALASADLAGAASSIVTFGSTLGVAVGPHLVVAAFDGPAPGSGTAELVKDLGSIAVYRTTDPLPAFLRVSNTTRADRALAGIGAAPDGTLAFSPGWLGRPTNGNVLVSLATGALLGLQTTTGRMVDASVLRDLLASDLPVDKVESEPPEDYFEKVSAESYDDRKGYVSNFLGPEVPLPITSKKFKLLHYENFTVAMHPPRKVAIFTAVNINGRSTVPTTRTTDPWKLDPRIDVDDQIGKHYYEGTPFDRGHMVRRLDPVWGDASKKAELDTFHYPNSCPQHKDLNRKTWNDLEDYFYDNLKRDKMRVTVFTGPVLSAGDPIYHDVQLPQEFWKVAVIKTEQGQLSATGYILSQEEMIEGLEFVYGEFRTYQVSIKLIEKKTGLDFGELRKFDPKMKSAGLEGAPLEIRSHKDLDLTPPPAPSPWGDPGAAENKLKLALNSFDWKTADELTAGLIDRLRQDSTGFSEVQAKRVLSALRRKRRFQSMTCVAESFLQAEISTAVVRRQYAQSLIDQSIFTAADLVLHHILANPATPADEREEAQGLLGRVFKQTYVDAAAPENPRNANHLQTAFDAYWGTYSVNTSLYWHGINVVAILARADRDGIKLNSSVDYRKIAEDILKTLSSIEASSKDGELDAFGLATRVEAYLALDARKEALQAADAYTNAKDADAFEIGSTLRQFEQVWQLKEDSPSGALLPLLRSALLMRQGGALQLSAATIKLEKVFGSGTSKALEWYRTGLDRARSVLRASLVYLPLLLALLLLDGSPH